MAMFEISEKVWKVASIRTVTKGLRGLQELSVWNSRGKKIQDLGTWKKKVLEIRVTIELIESYSAEKNEKDAKVAKFGGFDWLEKCSHVEWLSYLNARNKERRMKEFNKGKRHEIFCES